MCRAPFTGELFPIALISRTVGGIELKSVFFWFFLILGAGISQRKPTHPTPHQIQSIPPFLIRFFFLKKTDIPQQNQQNHGCLSTSQAEPPGASERSGWRLSGSAPNSGPSLPAPGRMGMEGPIFAQIFWGAKQKTHIFQPLFFFF